MDDFPQFLRAAANRIATSSQATPGVEGYVFEGADGSQMTFWKCHEAAASATQVHDYDEYLLEVQGCYTLLIDGQRIPLHAADERFIPRACPMRARFWRGPEPFTHLLVTGSTESGIELYGRHFTDGQASMPTGKHRFAVPRFTLAGAAKKGSPTCETRPVKKFPS